MRGREAREKNRLRERGREKREGREREGEKGRAEGVEVETWR